MSEGSSEGFRMSEGSSGGFGMSGGSSGGFGMSGGSSGGFTSGTRAENMFFCSMQVSASPTSNVLVSLGTP